MYLIVKYHQHADPSQEHLSPPEHEWLPTWRIDGPDEQPADHSRGATISLTGEAHLPILAPGATLAQGEIYLDLKHPAIGPFRALEGQTAGHGNAYVAQGNLAPEFWNQLVRVCARAGALAIDADRTGTSCDVTIVMEPVTPPIARAGELQGSDAQH